jgi:hypothetical protein
MTWISTSDDPMQWKNAGFIDVVTPVRAPTSTDRSAHIRVVIRVPSGTMISASSMPVGSQAARIEYGTSDADPDAKVSSAWKVLDVRSFEWTSNGLDCLVQRPDGDGRLEGLRWRCSTGNDARAGELLAQYVREQRFSGPRSSDGRQQAGRHIASINGCSDCHQANRPENRSVGALVQRGTDNAGMFSLMSAFHDQDPLERYRPTDSNAGDRWLTAVCPQSEIDLEAARCRDTLRPRLRLDVRGGLLAGDRHVQQLCNSRQQLAKIFDASLAATVEPALLPCEPIRPPAN